MINTKKYPTVAIVGQPNAGKSTLFNRLTRSRSALIFDTPGVTKDRQYGNVSLVDNKEFSIIDTAGWIEKPEEKSLEILMKQQVQIAIDESDLILVIFDAKNSFSSLDEKIVSAVRGSGKAFICAVNKSEGIRSESIAEFFAVGAPIVSISAINGSGIQGLLSLIYEKFDKMECFENLSEHSEVDDTENFSTESLSKREARRQLVQAAKEHRRLEKEVKKSLNDVITEEEEQINHEDRLKMPIKIAIVGRPNVGKSTLINQVMGFDRVIVSDIAGTTTDTIHVPFRYEKSSGKHQDYVLIDTAGIRRKAQVKAVLEKFSISKTLEAIRNADVVLHVVNAREGLVEQDIHLLGLSIENGKSIVLAINQWDGADSYQRKIVNEDIDRKLAFATFFDIHRISAIKGTNIKSIFTSIDSAFINSLRQYNTSKMMVILKDIVTSRPPDNVRNRAPKFKFISQTSVQPPTLMIRGNTVLKQLTDSYKRYLVSAFRKKCKWQGSAVRLELVWQDNPYDEKIKQSSKGIQFHKSITTL